MQTALSWQGLSRPPRLSLPPTWASIPRLAICRVTVRLAPFRPWAGRIPALTVHAYLLFWIAETAVTIRPDYGAGDVSGLPFSVTKVAINFTAELLLLIPSCIFPGSM